MKKCWFVILMALLLCGCHKTGKMETVMDTIIPQELPEMQKMSFYVPDDAVSEVFAQENERQIYFCDDFILTAEIKEAGDLQKSLKEITGYDYTQLSVFETKQQDLKRYDCVWSTLGENCEEVGRCAVLDDGTYHYILAVFAPSENTGELTDSVWNAMFSSFCLYGPNEIIDSGS